MPFSTRVANLFWVGIVGRYDESIEEYFLLVCQMNWKYGMHFFFLELGV